MKRTISSLFLACFALSASAVLDIDDPGTVVSYTTTDIVSGVISDTADVVTDGTAGMTDDSVTGKMDITGLLTNTAIAANQDVRLTVTLSPDDITFAALPVMGDIWDGDSSESFGLFSGGTGTSSTVFRVISGDGFSTTSTFAIDVRGLNVPSAKNVQVTVQTATADNFGLNVLKEVTKAYIVFPDSDSDGVSDGEDLFPLDPNESIDTDLDGIGNNADTDDDGDGVLDSDDAFPLDGSKSQSETDTNSNTEYSGFVYLMTNSNSNNVTSLHIVNTSGASQTFTGTLYNGNGGQLGGNRRNTACCHSRG